MQVKRTCSDLPSIVAITVSPSITSDTVALVIVVFCAERESVAARTMLVSVRNDVYPAQEHTPARMFQSNENTD